MLRTSIRAKSLIWASSKSLLLTVRMPRGMVPVGSKGSTTGGKVLGGKVGSVPKASEFVIVNAPLGSMSSRKYKRTTLTPGTDFDSTLRTPGDWLTHRSIRFVMVFSMEEA